MVYTDSRLSSELNIKSQIASPATSIRWGATPTPSMYIASPRASLEVMRTPGGFPVMMGGMSRTNSAQKIAAQHDVAVKKQEKKEKKEKKGVMNKIKKSVNKGTQDYWTNGMNIHYSGVFARV